MDNLRGLKENVIMGCLISAGTGAPYYRELRYRLKDKEGVVSEYVAKQQLLAVNHP